MWCDGCYGGDEGFELLVCRSLKAFLVSFFVILSEIWQDVQLYIFLGIKESLKVEEILVWLLAFIRCYHFFYIYIFILLLFLTTFSSYQTFLVWFAFLFLLWCFFVLIFSYIFVFEVVLSLFLWRLSFVFYLLEAGWGSCSSGCFPWYRLALFADYDFHLVSVLRSGGSFVRGVSWCFVIGSIFNNNFFLIAHDFFSSIKLSFLIFLELFL